MGRRGACCRPCCGADRIADKRRSARGRRAFVMPTTERVSGDWRRNTSPLASRGQDANRDREATMSRAATARPRFAGAAIAARRPTCRRIESAWKNAAARRPRRRVDHIGSIRT
ncbi:hypothetical protein AZ78_4518 [Lysobacter capsici AZ78]|uniref:Uncharacterized protein n=1 Tax=Lysobacter capsici AZ78 TaxID=1444315 RepID=A0A108UD07_9GAMM|nr:hypothetical protein AZ78_4518 [Lysobacter capsici AZ78]